VKARCHELITVFSERTIGARQISPCFFVQSYYAPRQKEANMKLRLALVGIMLGSGAPVGAWADEQQPNCNLSSSLVGHIQAQLQAVVNLPDANGGIFKPNRMWSAVVDRQGTLCSVVNTNATSGDAWPGSRAIAIAKAGTANDFSNSALALSTANLYAPTQPGGSLYGLNNSNPFNPRFQPIGTGINDVPGGIITFGGGVALYQNGRVIGGLGVSGDSSCADHAIAYRMRHKAGLDAIPAGVGPNNTDNIAYAAAGQPPTGFQQPHCFPQDITP
jgi:uncharacterized protein GlcG (DUF336 family)